MGHPFLPLLMLVPVSGWGQVLPKPLPAFEVVSVRLTPRASIGYTSFSPYGTNRYTVTNADLYFLVELAYAIPFEQISGVAKLGSEHYDVIAKAEDGVILTYEELQPRLQRLLSERFKLTVHRETKEFDGYALVIAKGGPKLRPTKGISEQGGSFSGGFRFMNVPLSLFAALLRSAAGRPVVDRTGIEGSFDFTLNYAKDDDPQSPLPSFTTALEEQYGLKLEKTKVPLEILVIDSVEQIPSEN